VHQGCERRRAARAPGAAHHPRSSATRAPIRSGPTTWDDALDRIAAAIIATQQRYGRDAVGAFGGGGLTNEKAYQFGKFVRVALRSRHIDYNGRFRMQIIVDA
jgi:predicted molibdopterin-dependent oxidoreductase YjgC